MIPAPGGEIAYEGDSISRPCTLIPCPLSLFPSPVHKNEGASGDMYENKGTEIFQVGTPRETCRGSARNDPISGRGGGEHDSIPRFRNHDPFPVSLIPSPVHKNEGASGDIYENKGTEKMPLMIPAPEWGECL